MQTSVSLFLLLRHLSFPPHNMDVTHLSEGFVGFFSRDYMIKTCQFDYLFAKLPIYTLLSDTDIQYCMCKMRWFLNVS